MWRKHQRSELPESSRPDTRIIPTVMVIAIPVMKGIAIASTPHIRTAIPQMLVPRELLSTAFSKSFTCCLSLSHFSSIKLHIQSHENLELGLARTLV